MHWLPIDTAPAFVSPREAFIGCRDQSGRWDRVALWEAEWPRNIVQGRGATHWCRIAPPPDPESDDAFRELRIMAGCPLSGI